MAMMAKGIDLYFSDGASREAIAAALVRFARLPARAIADFAGADYADVIAYGRWAWLHSFAPGKIFAWKASLEMNSDIDFEPIILQLRDHLGVTVAVPDEASPLPSAMIFFHADGMISRRNVDDEEFE